MLITLRKVRQTSLSIYWLVSYDSELKSITTRKNSRKESLTMMRHVICKATRLDAKHFRFIGNRRVNGAWISEWIKLDG